MPRKDAVSGPISAQAQQDLVSDGIENFELPKSLVTKIAKSALPENAKLQKETVLSLVKGSTVFINYLAATAHDIAVSKQHKSISASDVLKALETIEFGDLVEKLSAELLVYRANAKTDKKKAPVSASASASASAPPKPLAIKGKAKTKAVEQGAPFTSAPLPTYPERQQVDQMEVDWEQELGEAAEMSTSGAVYHDEEIEGEGAESEGMFDQDQDQDQDEDEHQDEGDQDLEEDEGDEEGAEELEDPMEVEEAELRKDAKGLEDAAEGSHAAGHAAEPPHSP